MTTIYVDSRKRVAGSDSDFKVDLQESTRRQAGRTRSESRTASCRQTESRYLYWVNAAHAELGAPVGGGVYGRPEQPHRCLQRQPADPDDLELQQQFSDAVDYPTSPLRVCQVDGIQRGLPALRPAGQRQPRAGQSEGTTHKR